MSDALDRAIDVANAIVMTVAAIALVLMMMHVTFDVAGKYFLNKPIPMTLEMVSTYYMVAVVFLPLAAAERLEGHIHVELISAALPKLGQRLLDALAYLLSAIFFIALTRYAWRMAIDKYEVGEFTMGSHALVVWPTRFLLPIGTALVSVLLLLKLARVIARIARGDYERLPIPAEHT